MVPELYLPRLAEAEIIRRLSFNPAVVIVGPRQVGKTSITNAVRNQLGKPSIYLDLERPQDLAKINDLEAFAEIHLDSVIIIDEIQRKPSLFPELRSVIDRNRFPGRFILLGSASLALIRDSSESLAGRISILELTGFQKEEISNHLSFRNHWLRGGFPKSLLMEDESRSFEWRLDFVQTYLERDLPQLGLTADPKKIHRLWTMLAHLSGQTINKTKVAQSLDFNVATLTKYIDFMDQAYLIRQLPPYFANIGKRLVKSQKVYLRDTGILHQLLGIMSMTDLMGHPIIGASWENYVIEQLFAIKPRWADFFFYRTQAGVEIDIIVTRGGIAQIAVEIKYSSTPSLGKGFFIACNDLQLDKRFVIAPVEDNYTMKNGVTVIGPNHLASIFN